MTLPDGSTVQEFVANDALRIHREVRNGSPDRIVLSGPWGTFAQDWSDATGRITTENVVGPKPHVTVPLRHAKELIDYLTDNYIQERQLFRGVSSAEYRLVPVALRTGIASPPFQPIPTTNSQQIAQEAAAAMHFYEAVYYQGLTIPKWNEVADIFNVMRVHLRRWQWTDQISLFLA